MPSLTQNTVCNSAFGINVGDVIYDEARIYGDGINVAARLEGIAEPGSALTLMPHAHAREGRGGADRRALGSLRLAPAFYLRFFLCFRWWGEGWRSGVGSCRCCGAGCCGRVGSRATGSPLIDPD